MHKSKLTKVKAYAVGALIAAACGTAMAHDNMAYSHNSSDNISTSLDWSSDWMGSVAGDLKLSEISMVGTHDSGSYSDGGDIVLTQSMEYAQQLEAGIRVLDVRLRLTNGSFAIHHGVSYQNHMFGDVLNAVTDFLAEHPSETVLMRLGSAGISHDTSALSYSDTFDNYMNSYRHYHWQKTSNNPTLDEVRGKFVVLRNDSKISSSHGISYGLLDIQDEFSLGDNWDLYGKWLDVKDHLNKADNGSSNTIYMNYLSAASGSFPYFVASGHSNPATGAPRLQTGYTTPGWNSKYPDFPRVDCFIGICTIAFEGTNVLTTNYIKNGEVEFTGIVMADFPGQGLIDAVNKLNYHYTSLKSVYNSNKCLDVKSANFSNGTNVQVYNCNGSAAQKWLYDAAKEQLKTESGHCLTSRGDTDAFGRVEIWSCQDDNRNHQWYWDGDILLNRKSDLALDYYYSTGNAHQYPNLGFTNQRWTR